MKFGARVRRFLKKFVWGPLALAALSACVSKPDPATAARVAEKSASLTAARFACQAKVNQIFIPSLNPFLTCPEARDQVMAYMSTDEDCAQVLDAGHGELSCVEPDGGE